mgnify:CR=1 FL=1
MREQGGRRLNVSGVLRHLGVSRSGYNTWKNRIPSNQEQRKNKIKDKICDIYDESHQNYGAPKITKKLKEEGETISEKTVGNYMREMGLKAQWIKPYTTKIYLMRSLILIPLMRYGVQILHIFGLMNDLYI